MTITGAVITADIVNSTALGKAGPDLANQLQEIINANQAKLLSFYRGDSFQSYLVEPTPAYRLALMLRTEAKLFQSQLQDNLTTTDIKVSIGIGGIETPVQKISNAQGDAFVMSGRGLDELEKTGRRIIIQSPHRSINIGLRAIALFTDYLFDKLTVKQLEVLQHLLNNRTQIDIAKILDKSQSTINRHVQSMGWSQIEELLKLYSDSVQQITEIKNG